MKEDKQNLEHINSLFESEENKDYTEFIEKLYKENYKKFYRLAYSILKNEADAEDAVTETFLIIYKYIERIYNLKCPEIVPYCINIVKTVSYKMIKKQSKIIFLDYSEDLIDKTKCSEGADVTLEKMLENEELNNLLSKLSKLEYKILELRAVYKLKFKEIGKAIGVSEEAAKKRYQRIIKKLREEQGGCE